MIARLTDVYINQIISFVQEWDTLFPIPISHKADISEYVKKVLDNGTVFAYIVDEEIAGVLFGYANDTENYIAYLSLLCVNPAYQNRGIAKKLINEFKEYCNDAKMKKITLYTHVENAVAIKLYQKYGFNMENSDRADNYFFVYDIEGREKQC